MWEEVFEDVKEDEYIQQMIWKMIVKNNSYNPWLVQKYNDDVLSGKTTSVGRSVSLDGDYERKVVLKFQELAEVWTWHTRFDLYLTHPMDAMIMLSQFWVSEGSSWQWVDKQNQMVVTSKSDDDDDNDDDVEIDYVNKDDFPGVPKYIVGEHHRIPGRIEYRKSSKGS